MFRRIAFIILASALITLTDAAELSVTNKMLHYSTPKSEIYSTNFIAIKTPEISYAFTYSTIRNAYFCLVLTDENQTLKQIKIKEEHHLTAYKNYEDCIVITSYVNPSAKEYYIYKYADGSMQSYIAAELIVIKGKIVALVYPPQYSNNKTSVQIMVDNSEKLSLPFSYYSIETLGNGQLKIIDNDYSNTRTDTQTKSDELQQERIISI